MLNLNYTSVYQYSQTEKQHLTSLKRRKYGRRYQKTFGESKKRVWYDGEVNSIRIKHKIIRKLLLESRFRCSYCGKRLTASEKPVDHFIPNSLYPIYSFHPLNLVPSCGYCNSTLKGHMDPIINLNKKYSRISFSIIHPIIDDVDFHIIYVDPDKTVLNLALCSPRAIETIRIFHSDTTEMLFERQSQAILEVFLPLTDVMLIDLINECATYRP